MRARLNRLVDLMVGKFGDNIFSAPKGSSAGYIQTIRDYTKPYNPNTAGQQLTRNTFRYGNTFFYDGTDQTIGATTFDMGATKDAIKANAQALTFRGVPTDGNNAGIQLMLGAMVKQKGNVRVAAIVSAGLIPGTFVLEADLIEFIDVWTNIITPEMAAMVQRDRIGYSV